MTFDIIIAVDSQNGMGKNNDLPWHLPNELKHFQKITTKLTNQNNKNAVIMGRNTWESIPKNRRPLKNRLNIVLTKQSHYRVDSDVMLANSVDNALLRIDLFNKEADKNNHLSKIENIFVIGGAQVLVDAIHHKNCKKIYLTKINKNFHCDVFFPEIPKDFVEIERSEVFIEGSVEYYFVTYLKQKN